MSVIMSNPRANNPRKPIFNGHLLQLNDKPLKFYLDGYNSCEFHALTKIIEAYGGRLTVPDKDTIIFAERDRPVQKYYYRYDIKFIYDCMVKNRMQNINNYLLPKTPNSPIKSESPRSEPSNVRQKDPELNHRGTDSSRRTQEKLPTKEDKTLQNNSTLISSSDEESPQKSSNIRTKPYSLPARCSINAMPSLNPSTSNSTSKSALKEAIICISDDSDSEPPKLDKSAVTDVNHGINNDVKRQRIDQSNNGGCSDESRRSNLPNTSASFHSDEVRDSSFSSSSAVNLDHTCDSSINGSRRRMVARKSTTKNGGDVVIHKGEGDKKRKILYSEKENKTIIQWLIEKKAISKAGSGAVWKEIKRDGILVNPPRSAASLLNYFSRSLKYKYAKYTHDAEALAEFKQLVLRNRNKL